MAKTITQLPDATVVNGSDELIIQQGGVTKRATKTEVLAGIANADVDAAAAIEGTKIDPDFGAQNVETTGAVLGGPGTVFSGSSSGDMVRITQTGAGNALVVEDSTNVDATPFAVDATGTVICGHTVANNNVNNALETHGLTQRDLSIFSYNENRSNGFPAIRFARSASGTVGVNSLNNTVPLPLSTGHTIGVIDFRVHDDTNFVPAATISAALDGVAGTADMPGRLLFATTADGAATPTERMRIDSAGNVGIGGAPNAAAALDVASTVAGFLPPRMPTALRDSISSPPAGLMVYNTLTNKLNFYNGTAWEVVTSA